MWLQHPRWPAQLNCIERIVGSRAEARRRRRMHEHVANMAATCHMLAILPRPSPRLLLSRWPSLRLSLFDKLFPSPSLTSNSIGATLPADLDAQFGQFSLQVINALVSYFLICKSSPNFDSEYVDKFSLWHSYILLYLSRDLEFSSILTWQLLSLLSFFALWWL